MNVSKFILTFVMAGLTLGQAFAVEAINEQRKVTAKEKIYIEAMRGEVKIMASDNPVFKVVGTLDEQAQGFELTSKTGFTSFKVKMPKLTSFRDDDGRGSQLTIEVPKGAELEFKGVSTDVEVEGVMGSTKIKSVNGDIKGHQLQNFVDLNTVNGDIHSKANSGEISLRTVNGEISDDASSGRLQLNAVNGEIKSKTHAKDVGVNVVNGSIDLDLIGVEILNMKGVNGDLEAAIQQSKTPRVSISTVSGSATLKVEKTLNAKFTIKSSAGGVIDNELTQDTTTAAKHGAKSSLEFSNGGGEGHVEMSTVSGRLKVTSL